MGRYAIPFGPSFHRSHRFIQPIFTVHVLSEDDSTSDPHVYARCTVATLCPTNDAASQYWTEVCATFQTAANECVAHTLIEVPVQEES